QRPLPSQNKILMRLRWRLLKTNQWPESGSCCNTDCVSAKSRLKLPRRSMGVVATNTRVATERFSSMTTVVESKWRASHAPDGQSRHRGEPLPPPTSGMALALSLQQTPEWNFARL